MCRPLLRLLNNRFLLQRVTFSKPAWILSRPCLPCFIAANCSDVLFNGGVYSGVYTAAGTVDGRPVFSATDSDGITYIITFSYESTTTSRRLEAAGGDFEGILRSFVGRGYRSNGGKDVDCGIATCTIKPEGFLVSRPTEDSHQCPLLPIVNKSPFRLMLTSWRSFPGCAHSRGTSSGSGSQGGKFTAGRCCRCGHT